MMKVQQQAARVGWDTNQQRSAGIGAEMHLIFNRL
jgi:hypothetical protein